MFVFEREIPSFAPYLALQENRDVTPAEITYAQRLETKGVSVSGVCGIVGKNLQSEISCGQACHHKPVEKAGLGGPATAVHMVPRCMCLQLPHWVSLKLGLGR